jgi:hypothetical protein
MWVLLYLAKHSFEPFTTCKVCWLVDGCLLRMSALQDLWEGLSKPATPKAAPAANVMLVGPLKR